LDEAEKLLRAHGDTSVAERLGDSRHRLAAGDMSAIQSALSESTGSMGSLRDRFLCPENGDRIEQADVSAVNQRLNAVVDGIKHRAEDARRLHGV